ncbi:hypothetical protein N0V83_003826 [Neocucurbitaria cava]|uniref:Uncharacterized protein n=1 Tax=Neocucurbitaria cava TaxID=798079 RepID=A0A9W9CNG7_9PLEO|nr:hypothetical protein N0V83_003826 [Neocucurbitaria cava]
MPKAQKERKPNTTSRRHPFEKKAEKEKKVEKERSPSLTTSIRDPFEENQRHVEFKKSEGSFIGRGRMNRATWNTLNSRGCIEAENLPECDLMNDTHPIFRREAFTNISDDEYERIQPAVTLASRFITEDEYMGFWTHMCTGEVVDDDDRPGYQVIQAATTKKRNKGHKDDGKVRTRHELEEIAIGLTFFMFDEAWSEVNTTRSAESFFDSVCKNCRRRDDLEDGCQPGECVRCEGNEVRHRCYICGEGEQEGPATPYRTTDEQLSQLQVGLNWHILKHIRKTLDDEDWTPSEELRFQMAVATTLVHELVHMFWYWTGRKCWNCEDAEPWWSRAEEPLLETPELGHSWEYWAFGAPIPEAGQLQTDADQGRPNRFHRVQWNYVRETVAAGRDLHGAMSHDFIIPVQYINAWFQESTWRAIAKRGRVAGRPNHNDSVITRVQVKELDSADGSWGLCDYTVERYDYTTLVARGGFIGEGEGDTKFLYGAAKLTTKKLTQAYVDRLAYAFSRKQEKPKQAVKKRRDSGESKPSSKVSKKKSVINGTKTGRVTKR